MGREVDRICRASGFLAVVNHGISDETISNAWAPPAPFSICPMSSRIRRAPPIRAIPTAISARAPRRSPAPRAWKARPISRKVSMAARSRRPKGSPMKRR
ncbi:hypothetical protein [Rhizobium sp. G21]|uniref:hypothetical protein n=1 Tax=Rhizobium sp. G21 TaxID=2758439 RepID=UPI0039182EC8